MRTCRWPGTKQLQVLERFCRPCQGRVRHRSVEVRRWTEMLAGLMPGVLALHCKKLGRGRCRGLSDCVSNTSTDRGPAAPDSDSRCRGCDSLLPCWQLILVPVPGVGSAEGLRVLVRLLRMLCRQLEAAAPYAMMWYSGGSQYAVACEPVPLFSCTNTYLRRREKSI